MRSFIRGQSMLFMLIDQKKKSIERVRRQESVCLEVGTAGDIYQKPLEFRVDRLCSTASQE